MIVKVCGVHVRVCVFSCPDNNTIFVHEGIVIIIISKVKTYRSFEGHGHSPIKIRVYKYIPLVKMFLSAL